MSSSRNRRRQRERARRRRQVLLQKMILVAVIAVIFFVIVNRVTQSRHAEIPVSADTQNTAVEVPTVTETPAVTEAQALTEAPAATETPAVTEEPEATETPAVTETPEAEEAAAAEEDVQEEEDPLAVFPEEEETPFTLLNSTVERAKERQALLNMNDEALAEELRVREVPEELVEFMEEYPETREFVVDYLFQPEVPPSQDISGEVTKGVIPHFLQWDARWGYDMYGNSTIAVSGCGPTAMSEVYSGLTGKTDMNPYEMAQWAQNIGYHIEGSGTAWEMMGTGARSLGLEAWTIAPTEDAILETLRDGYPIIAAMAPGDFTYFGHFIVLVSADANGNISIRDSNSNIRTQRTWTADELLWQINQMWAYGYETYPE